MAVEIDTWTELAAMASGLDGDYVLTGNLGTSDGDYPTNWTPIGNVTTKFTGTLDGNNYTIDGLAFTGTTLDYQGLFAYTSGATVIDINFTNAVIKGDDYCATVAGYAYGGVFYNIDVSFSFDCDGYSGGIIGRTAYLDYVNVSISNCNVICTSGNLGGSFFGGIVGYGNYVNILDCTADVTFTNTGSSNDNIGGIIGYISYSMCLNSHADLTINCTTSYNSTDWGGAIGTAGYAYINNCYSSISVINFEGSYIGGFIGDNSNNTVITNCYCTGDIIQNYSVIRPNFGGFAGYSAASSLIANCYCSGDVTVFGDDAGGFIGENAGRIINCYSRGNVLNSGTYGGGFIGNNVAGGIVLDCYSTGSATGTTTAGGFDAINAGTITNCFWDTDTSGMLTSTSGTGKTTTEMQTLTTFSSVWPIVDLDSATLANPPHWIIDDGSSYPLIRVKSSSLSRIEGNVTLSSSPLSGAKITVINSTSNLIENVGNSDGSGNYSIPVRPGTYHITCEYETGGITYSDASKPNVVVS